MFIPRRTRLASRAFGIRLKSSIVQLSRRHYTVDDYFGVEIGSPIRHEYFDGEIYAMAGGTREHDTIAGNVFAAFHQALRGSACQAFTSNMRVLTPSGLYTYPDASVVCGPADLSGVEGRTTLRNPVVLVEVLSDSTRDYDRGDKFHLYRSIASLRHYLLIEQSSIEVEIRSLDSNGEWTSEVKRSLDDTLRVEGAAIELPLSRVYDRIT
jgi:Uma2 family endonuclease